MVYHQWIQFLETTSQRPSFAEPEAWIERPKEIILFEAKLTGKPYGKLQMEGLYKPLIEHILAKPVRCLMVCRHVDQHTPGPFVGSPEEFMASDLPFATWHVLL